ncbi:MAG TPA: glutamine amidotransferase [Candidatus Scatomorpha merdipullorum]|uniref:Lipid II isoglutaminyl synthase (glutamine-hydrolyzing) subunit GatD n=1 Tax=Candidatus Scatomorpha merdipullorum TaxID=2840927 RepID=A0A9D1FDT1_9FIRM|nr:glutamine amidotransferase [Candidatus Scatomorpha merdipullorum]
MMELKICHLYPDVLNLYGDRGNVLAMKKRLEWRGIGCTVDEIPIGERLPLSKFDLIFIGGGQDFEQGLLLDDLRSGKGEDIRSAVEDGLTFLTVCGGYQLMGRYYETHTGEKLPFLGALDLYTVGGEERLIGNFAFETEYGPVVGFENHSGRTYLGEGVKPLGRVIRGRGNNGKDGTEGARYKNVFGTYSHGPVLPKNPEFCDTILLTALRRRYPSAELEPLADLSEREAHDSVLKSLTGE